MQKTLYDAQSGEYTSLAGRRGKNGLSVIGQHSINVISTGTQVLSANLSRVHATIRNMTDADGSTPQDCWVALASITEGLDSDQWALLRPGDVFCIDRDHPWSGPVTCYTQLGITSGVDWWEVSVT